MDFEFYEKKTGTNAEPNPRVTLTDTMISFNPDAVREYLNPLAEKLKMACIGYVQLGYCNKTQIIGLFPAVEEDRKTVCVQQKKGEAARIGVTGFVKRFNLQDKTYRVLSVEPQEKGLFLKWTDEKVHKRKYKKKAPPPGPIEHPPAPPQKVIEEPADMTASRLARQRARLPERPLRVVQYQCVGCGYSNIDWKLLYPITGTPDACPKCRGSQFEEI